MSVRRRIAATVVCSDLVAKLGSGCTIKFVPLYFLERCHMTPITVNAVSALGPLGAAAMAIAVQKMSRRVGRVEITWITKVLGAVSLAGIAFIDTNWLIIALYLGRVCLMNCSTGLTKSVLNDYVPKSERARWNSFEAVNTFGWSGSAAIGGFIIEKHGYRVMFLITALMQIVAATILLSVAPLVHKEVSSPSSKNKAPKHNPSRLAEPLLRPSDDHNDHDHNAVRTTSEAGYSLLEFHQDDNADDRDSFDDDRSDADERSDERSLASTTDGDDTDDFAESSSSSTSEQQHHPTAKGHGSPSSSDTFMTI